MVMRLNIEQHGLLRTLADMELLPRNLVRFRRSALAQTGFYLSSELRNYLEEKQVRQELADVTDKFRKKFRKKDRWRRRRKKHPGAVSWLAKFTRYRVDRRGTEVQVDFGKSKRGEPGRRDPVLAGIVRNIQEGYSVRVTPKMRRFFASTRGKRKNPGLNFFPLSKKTTKIVVEPRPIIDPFFEEISPKASDFFEERFIARIRRFNSGGG